MNLKLTITGGAKHWFSWRLDDGKRLLAQAAAYIDLQNMRRDIVSMVVALQSDDFVVVDGTEGALLKLGHRKLEAEVGKHVARRHAAKKAAATRRSQISR
jgi:hypothetical protein